MPVVHKYKSGRGFYIKANQGGKITTYQVTEAGGAVLKSRGHGDGSPLSPAELMQLARQGHVYTGGSGPGQIDPFAGTPVAPPPHPQPKAPPSQSQSPKKNKLSRRERKRMRQAAWEGTSPSPAPPVWAPSSPPVPVPPDPPLWLPPDDTDKPWLELSLLDTQAVTPPADPGERRPEVIPLDPPPVEGAAPDTPPRVSTGPAMIRQPKRRAGQTADRVKPRRLPAPRQKPNGRTVAKRWLAAALAVLFVFPVWLRS